MSATFGRAAGAVALVLTCTFFFVSGEAGAAGSYIDFERHDAQKALAAGAERGVVVKEGSVRLARGKTTGTLTSKAYSTMTRFDTLLPSWNATTPSGTYVRMEVRVRSGGGWTRWWNMGIWARGTDTARRQSVNGQRYGSWEVATDTLQSIGPVFADAYQYRITLATKRSGRSPRVDSLAFTASDSYRHGDFLGVAGGKYLGTDLPVPQRSQMIYPNGGEVWCSPTSLSMVMAYWANRTGEPALNQTVPTVAGGTYDYAYGGNGNWPFNTAYASSFGLKTSVNRFSSLGQVERWVSKGIPVVASISWSRGQLDGAPIPASQGHLLVIRGFDRTGKYVIVNDPAASSNSGVRRVYDRQQFADAWMRGSGGVAYIIHPKGWSVPASTDARGSW